MTSSSIHLETHALSPTHIHTAKWLAFDLDDTLHSFRHASSLATSSVLSSISTLTSHPLSSLQTTYSLILAQGTAAAFTDGKTSHQYREARFRALLSACNLTLPNDAMADLVALYESVLMANLRRKPGVLQLFATLKRRGFKIAIVTEGPQDAQERTVEALGIDPYVDFLATTNGLGVAKVNGLFGRVLERLGLRPGEMVVVGDSWERDVKPAREAGMYCVWFAEKGLGGRKEEEGWGWVTEFEALRAVVEGKED